MRANPAPHAMASYSEARARVHPRTDRFNARICHSMRYGMTSAPSYAA